MWAVLIVELDNWLLHVAARLSDAIPCSCPPRQRDTWKLGKFGKAPVFVSMVEPPPLLDGPPKKKENFGDILWSIRLKIFCILHVLTN